MNKKGFSPIVIILVLVVVVGYLIYDYSANKGIDYSTNKSIVLGISEDKQMCPTIYNPSGVSPAVSETNFNSLPAMISTMNNLLNQKVWTIRNNMGSCYKGQFQNQNPNKFYCEYMVVSRWDLSSAGTINYRLYTTVTGIWAPESDGIKYTFEGFSCEDTQKVIVKKGEHKFYVHDTRTGTPINIEISGDETPINLKY